LTFEADLIELNKNYLVGRALDTGWWIYDRRSCERLNENKKKLPFGLYIVNAVQEEIGLRGAEMISRRLRPDLAICTDVYARHTVAYVTTRRERQPEVWSWSYFVLRPAVQTNVLKMIIQVAEKKKIPSNARLYHGRPVRIPTLSPILRKEFASALISLPLKYMHYDGGNGTQGRRRKRDPAHLRGIAPGEPGHDFRYIK